MRKYLENNNLNRLINYLNNDTLDVPLIYHPEILNVRQQLGRAVLDELPRLKPNVVSSYNIAIDNHEIISLLIKSPIAVAESINGIQEEYPIWAGDEHREIIRRNIQYSQYLTPDFYNHVLLYVLTQN
ncbi:hypothetical protein RIU17_09855 [Riemerella anatipestifer]|nr:hypothetical protein [Riemerella anatipestifer]